MKLPREALAFLVENGYAVDIGHGWHRVDRAPSTPTWTQPERRSDSDKARAASKYKREVDAFVKAIKILGAWSVTGASGKPGAVEVSTGVEPDETLFRLRSETFSNRAEVVASNVPGEKGRTGTVVTTLELDEPGNGMKMRQKLVMDDHAYKWSPDGPECGVCGEVHSRPRDPPPDGDSA